MMLPAGHVAIAAHGRPDELGDLLEAIASQKYVSTIPVVLSVPDRLTAIRPSGLFALPKAWDVQVVEGATGLIAQRNRGISAIADNDKYV